MRRDVMGLIVMGRDVMGKFPRGELSGNHKTAYLKIYPFKIKVNVLTNNKLNLELKIHQGAGSLI
jgi:hypothetical protein